MISERQKNFINLTVNDYLETGRPVASQELKERYSLKYSAATIRNELRRLEKKGYLRKTYISSGKIPEDKAIKFFIKSVITEAKIDDELKYFRKILKESLRSPADLIENVARLSEGFSIGFVEENFIEAGFARIFDVFGDNINALKSLFEYLDKKEKIIEQLEYLASFNQPKILLGADSRLTKKINGAIVISGIKFHAKKGFVSIIGSKRMNYLKNMVLAKAVQELFNIE